MYIVQLYMLNSFFSSYCSANQEIAIKLRISNETDIKKELSLREGESERKRAREQKPFSQRQICSNYICDQSTTQSRHEITLPLNA